MRRIMQEMIFRARPVQTLYTALLDAMRLYGRQRKLVEDMRQTEYSYTRAAQDDSGARAARATQQRARRRRLGF